MVFGKVARVCLGVGSGFVLSDLGSREESVSSMCACCRRRQRLVWGLGSTWGEGDAHVPFAEAKARR